MKRFIQLNILCAFLSVLFSCDNEVDVNAPWQEVTIAYGLLDMQDSVHYIKVNKAYLNQNRNAREIAQKNPDSIYHDHPINVKLQKMAGEQVQASYTLQKDTLHDKEPGLFAYPDHIMYRNVTPFHPDPNFTYRLKIDSLRQEEPVTARAQVIDTPTITNPRSRPGSKLISPAFGYNDEIPFAWQSSPSARFFEMDIHTIYYEQNTNTGNSYYDTVKWSVFNFLTDNDYDITSDQYFKQLGRKIEAKPNVTRPADSVKLEIFLSAGGEALYQYYRVNRPSISIVQKQPDYTNINNGRGLFSSKTTNTYPGRLPSVSFNTLINGQYTNDLNFSR